MSDYNAKYLPGHSVPLIVGAGGWVGGQLVTTSGVVAGALATDVAGVGAYDAPAGVSAAVLRQGIHRLVASGAITNGQLLQAGAAGTVATAGATPAAGTVIGRAWSTAANGALVDVALISV